MMPEVKPFWVNKYEVARGFRGRRHELRKHFETAKGPIARKFFSSILNAHTELMYQNLSPIRSYLWKAEKDGNLVYLFEDLHNIFQSRNMGLKFMDSGKFDASAYCSSFFHPTVLNAFENSDKLYVEISRFKHFDELQALHKENYNQMQTGDVSTSEESSSEDSDDEGELSLKFSTYLQTVELAEFIEGKDYIYDSGLVDRLMIIKDEGLLDARQITNI